MTQLLRKLATIVAVDVAGYSARTEADEAGATAEVAALRDVIAEITSRHAGRIFNTAGDGFMLEFSSSLAAVEAAQELAERCEPKVRVGVHLGDVAVQPNGDLLGHGVNVAARLMAQAAPGSALVSADVRRTIRGDLGNRLVARGAVHLDKMAETIETFTIAAVAMVGALACTSAEPTLVVLPFDNLSNDSEMQFFSDGVAEEILHAITRGSRLHVIGRTSAFQFRGERKGEAARVLKATHVLDGAVRRSGARMRVTAQLTEAASNRLLWSERYDRNVAEAFELQDDIAGKVATALNQTLTPPSAAPAQIDPVAYDLYLKAKPQLAEGVNSDLVAVEAMLAQAASRAPDVADIWALLARVRTHLLPSDHESIGEPLHEAARMAAHHALALDPNSGEALMAEALLKPAFAQHGEKLRLAEHAFRSTPKGPLVAVGYAGLLLTVGRCADALPVREHAMRLEPLSTMKAMQLAGVLHAIGRVDDSLAIIEDAWTRMAHTPWLSTARLFLHIVSGRLDEAARIARSGDATPLVKSLTDLISLLHKPVAERQAAFRLYPQVQNRTTVLDPQFCATLAFAGCDDLAIDLLLDALGSGRPIGVRGGTGTRAATLSPLFDTNGVRALQRNARFPQLCARVGLVEYWHGSGKWPDCASQVSYDFKAECAKAARQAATA